MTLAPPRLPRLDAAQRTLRQPPLPGITSPASGLAASHPQNAKRSSALQIASTSCLNSGVSAMVYMNASYGSAVYPSILRRPVAWLRSAGRFYSGFNTPPPHPPDSADH